MDDYLPRLKFFSMSFNMSYPNIVAFPRRGSEVENMPSKPDDFAELVTWNCLEYGCKERYVSPK